MKRMTILVTAVTALSLMLSLMVLAAFTFTSGTPELLKRWTGIGMIGTAVSTTITVMVLTSMKYRAQGRRFNEPENESNGCLASSFELDEFIGVNLVHCMKYPSLLLYG